MSLCLNLRLWPLILSGREKLCQIRKWIININFFSLDENVAIEYSKPVCSPPEGNTKEKFTFPGDFSSDAEFFVFVGVITWLYCAAT